MSRSAGLFRPYHDVVTDFQPGDLRVGDAEREAAMNALGEHMRAGRLTIDEYGDRTAQVTVAKTRGELSALFTDLPQPHPTFTQPGAAQQPAAGPAPAAEPPRPARRNWSGLPVSHRVFDALVPLAGLVGLAFVIFAHFWLLIFLPAVVVVLGQAVLGDDWRRRHEWRKHERKQLKRQEKWEERNERMQDRMERLSRRMERRRDRW